MVLIVYQSAKAFSIEKWIFGVKKEWLTKAILGESLIEQ
jgi:hypothetical protein